MAEAKYSLHCGAWSWTSAQGYHRDTIGNSSLPIVPRVVSNLYEAPSPRKDNVCTTHHQCSQKKTSTDRVEHIM